LAVIPITIPSLRERRGDIIHLANFFIEKHSSISSKKITGLSKEAEERLKELSWPGNVRELENVIERGVLLCKASELSLKDLLIEGSRHEKAAGSESNSKGGQTVWSMEKNLILSTLRELDENRTHAAERLGISIRTLRNKLNEYKEQGLL
jgi:DNA-binding NtrC family response regulator